VSRAGEDWQRFNRSTLVEGGKCKGPCCSQAPKVVGSNFKAAREGHDCETTFDDLCNASKRTLIQPRIGGVSVARPGRLEKELALVAWMITSKIPFAALHDPNATQMFKAFNVQLRGPESIKRLTFALHEIALRQAAAKIKAAFAYNVTMDYWTSTGGKHFLSITYHWTDDDWNVQAQTLHLVPVDGNATGELTMALVEARVEALFHPQEQWGEDLKGEGEDLHGK
jgi:hypothetical protein